MPHKRLKKLEAKAMDNLLDPSTTIWFDARNAEVPISIAIDFVRDLLVIFDTEYGDRIETSYIELKEI
jgi:hypothetical protein